MKKLLLVSFLFISFFSFAQSHVYTTTQVQLMKEPSTSGKGITVIEPKTRVQFVSQYDSTWSQVRIPGATGYIQNKMLSTLNTNLTQIEGLPIDSTTGKITLSEVLKVEGTNQDQLYSRAREWFVHTYKSADNVLQMDDKQAGKLIGKGWNPLRYNTVQMWYTFSVYLKDGRYKYEISDIHYKSNASTVEVSVPIEKVFENGTDNKPAIEKRRQDTVESLNLVIAKLKAAMDKKETGKDDW